MSQRVVGRAIRSENSIRTFLTLITAQKIKFSIKHFFSKSDEIRKKL